MVIKVVEQVVHRILIDLLIIKFSVCAEVDLGNIFKYRKIKRLRYDISA